MDERQHPTLPSGRKRAIQRALLAWYARARRSLPWRADPRPYEVWVAEIMAQQTRLAAVGPYFRRFLERFPDLAALAAASQDEVLACWSGLGYYSRARNLHQAARQIVARHGGRLPADPAELMRLPGIGRYSAGAIASIAFGVAAPVLDGNVIRVLCRLFDLDLDVDRTAGRRRLWALAEALVPAEQPGDFNQALMELGALVCSPLGPACPDCPLGRSCLARRHRTQAERPVRRPKRPPRPVAVAAAAVGRDDGALLFVQNPPAGLFGGLWTLPLFPADGRPVKRLDRPVVARALGRSLGLESTVGRRLAAVEHVLTHRRLLVRIYDCRLADGRPRLEGYQHWRWIKSPAQLGRLGVANLTAKLLAAIGHPLAAG